MSRFGGIKGNGTMGQKHEGPDELLPIRPLVSFGIQSKATSWDDISYSWSVPSPCPPFSNPCDNSYTWCERPYRH